VGGRAGSGPSRSRVTISGAQLAPQAGGVPGPASMGLAAVGALIGLAALRRRTRQPA